MARADGAHPLAVPCPVSWCQAKPGYRCKALDGTAARRNCHPERVTIAIKARQAEVDRARKLDPT